VSRLAQLEDPPHAFVGAARLRADGAFAAFDFLMSLDYRFFSTMWGVYFFAGAR
jgi:hypothetical protein